MLLAFLLGNTPKTYLHDLVADHRDLPECNQLHKTAVLHQETFNCHFDDLVVSVPFLLQAAVPFLTAPVLFGPMHADIADEVRICYLYHKENRGPPAV